MLFLAAAKDAAASDGKICAASAGAAGDVSRNMMTSVDLNLVHARNHSNSL
jgi:hypothetical protein